ncbi:uncharacterized protein ISCGN_022301 [Ixodes scapularis]
MIVPYVEYQESPEGIQLRGPLAAVADGLVRKFGLRSQVIFPKERTWGIKSNGTFSGFLGMMQAGGVDVMLGPMAPTLGRAEATDFSAPYDVNYVSLMTWKPVKFVDPFNFILSFSLEVWLGIFFSWTLLAFATARLDALVNRMSGRPDEGSFAGFFWVYFKLMFPNSYPSNRATWFRLLMGVWLLALVVLMGLLNCTLTSTMLVRKTTDYVDNFEDLVRFPKTLIATEKLTYFEAILKNPVGETFKKLSSRHEQVIGIYQAGPVLDFVMQQVLKKERVMIGTDVMLKSHIADNFVRTGECKHHVTRGTAGIMQIVMLVRKSLPREFKRKLDRYVTSINQCDIYHKEMEWRLRNYTRCQNEMDDAIKPLGMNDLQGGFLLLVVGLGSGAVAFVGEHLARNSPPPRRAGNAGRRRRCGLVLLQKKQTEGYK